MKRLLTALVLLVSLSSAQAAGVVPELEIRPLANDVYLHTSYQVVDGFGLVDSNGLVVLLGKDAYLIDTPWSAQDTQKLLDWIEARGLTLKGSVSTHFHDDRTAGIAFLNARNIPTHASTMTNDLLRRAGKPLASHAFSGDLRLAQGRIEVFYPGPGHTKDNLVVYLPNQKLLFGGCFIRAAEATNLGNVRDASVKLWPASAAKTLDRYPETQVVVPGHGKVGDASLLAHTRELALEANR